MAFKFTGFADEAGKTISDQIASTRAASWNSIELRLVNGINVCTMADDEWDMVYQQLVAANIVVAGFGGAIANWSRPIDHDFQTDIDEIARVAPRMKQVDCSLIRIMSYPNASPPWPHDDWKAEVFRRLRELTQLATAHGIILGHENCSGYGGIGADQTLEMLEAVDSNALTLIFDTGNATLETGDPEQTWQFYTACRPHISHIHIKAAKPGPDGQYIPCFPDEDPVQGQILADLVQTDYQGWISIEPHMAAAIHAGQDIADSDVARAIYVEYAQRLHRLVDSATSGVPS